MNIIRDIINSDIKQNLFFLSTIESITPLYFDDNTTHIKIGTAIYFSGVHNIKGLKKVEKKYKFLFNCIFTITLHIFIHFFLVAHERRNDQKYYACFGGKLS